jgi:hypothetical protein
MYREQTSEGILSTRDASIIRMYIAESKPSSGIGTIRAMKLAYSLTSWRRFIGEFGNLDITEVYEGIAKLIVMELGNNMAKLKYSMPCRGRGSTE